MIRRKKIKYLLLVICLFLIFAYASNEKKNYTLQGVELLNENNFFLVGKECFNPNPNVVSQNEQDRLADQTERDFPDIPDNPICFSVVDDVDITGTSIKEIVTSDNKTPEFIIPNGAIGIFSKGNANGWFCESNETISWDFEKFPMENGAPQTIGIGYIQDGVMHDIQLFRDSLDGKYELTVSEDGFYHIFVVCLSSDPISLKEGDIELKK